MYIFTYMCICIYLLRAYSRDPLKCAGIWDPLNATPWYAQVYVYVYKYMYKCMHICMYVCMFTHVYVYISLFHISSRSSEMWRYLRSAQWTTLLYINICIYVWICVCLHMRRYIYLFCAYLRDPQTCLRPADCNTLICIRMYVCARAYVCGYSRSNKVQR